MNDATDLFSPVEERGQMSSDQLLPLVYGELHRLAAAKLAHERFDHTLQPTALVHEAYLRLANGSADQSWDSRGHFFSAAAEAMRRILIENARRRKRIKHGGNHQQLALDESLLSTTLPDDRLLAIDEALERLTQEDKRAAELIKLRFFAGFSISEAAELLGISRSGAYGLWSYARAWLQCEVENGR